MAITGTSSRPPPPPSFLPSPSLSALRLFSPFLSYLSLLPSSPTFSPTFSSSAPFSFLLLLLVLTQQRHRETKESQRKIRHAQLLTRGVTCKLMQLTPAGCHFFPFRFCNQFFSLSSFSIRFSLFFVCRFFPENFPVNSGLCICKLWLPFVRSRSKNVQTFVGSDHDQHGKPSHTVHTLRLLKLQIAREFDVGSCKYDTRTSTGRGNILL